MSMTFHLEHIGVAVRDIDQALAQYTRTLGYQLCRGPFDDPQQQARVAFISNAGAGPLLELVAPLGPGSQVERVLAKGNGLYHLCYEVADIEESIAHLRKNGCLLISGPTPAVAYEGRPIAWLYTPSRQLTELVEAPAVSQSGEATA